MKALLVIMYYLLIVRSEQNVASSSNHERFSRMIFPLTAYGLSIHFDHALSVVKPQQIRKSYIIFIVCCF
uniref:Secreted protein n=1 Tax=Anguilla anguilla TaxID=7936 RepID=A0A0E9WUM5_ANGAN